MFKTYRKTATVQAKLFEKGDEDGFAIPDDQHIPVFLKEGNKYQGGVEEIPFVCSMENQRHFGLFGRYYLCMGVEGSAGWWKKPFLKKPMNLYRPAHGL